MMKQDIRLIALDLDGTALNSQKRLSERTSAALLQAAEQGIHIVVATGRTFSSLSEEVRQSPVFCCAITSNGAVVNRLPDGKILYHNYLKPQVIEELADIFREERVDAEVCTAGTAYIGQEYYDRILRGETRRDIYYVKITRHPVPSVYDFMLEHKHQIENINLNFPNDQEKKRWHKKMREYKKVTPTSSFLYNVELGSETASKAHALESMLESCGLTKEQLMVFGDSENDLDMISLAGIGVAMGNAEAEVKNAADLVTDNNDNDGVAKVIEKLLKGSVLV